MTNGKQGPFTHTNHFFSPQHKTSEGEFSMKGLNKKNVIRTVAVVLLIVAAFCIAFLLIPKLYKMEGATTNIIMLRQDVERGDVITESMIATVTVGAYGLDSTVIRDATAVIGKYAVADISSKDLLFPNKFADTDPTVNDPVTEPEIELAEGEMLLTLALSSTAAGAAGNILPGDLVNVAIFVQNPEEESAMRPSSSISDDSMLDDMLELFGDDHVIFPEELQGMTVYRVLTSSLDFVAPNGSATSTEGSRVPVYITLICTQPQADMLLDYSYREIVHFVEVE